MINRHKTIKNHGDVWAVNLWFKLRNHSRHFEVIPLRLFLQRPGRRGRESEKKMKN